jgi:hypothetical protein
MHVSSRVLLFQLCKGEQIGCFSCFVWRHSNMQLSPFCLQGHVLTHACTTLLSTVGQLAAAGSEHAHGSGNSSVVSRQTR